MSSDRPDDAEASQRLIRVFLAEDNRADARMVEEALRTSGLPYELSVHPDGSQAIEAFDQLGAGGEPCPDLVLLDINLPCRDGFEILSHIRGTEPGRHVPVAMVTSSDAPQDYDRASLLGANDYVHKSFDYDAFMASLLQLFHRVL